MSIGRTGCWVWKFCGEKNMKKIKTLFLITFFFSLFYTNINAEKSNEIETNKVISDEVSDQLQKLLDLYKDGVITGYEYEKEKKKILN